jgi:hypothetical protein
MRSSLRYPHFSGHLAFTRPQPGRVAGALLWLLVLLGSPAWAQRPLVQLDLLPSGGSNPDPISIYFEQGATTGFDSSLDASKLLNPSGLNLASIDASGQLMTINALPPTLLSAPLTVGLYVGVPQYGSYTLQASKLNNFAGTDIDLVDNLLSINTPLALGTSYSFDLTAANSAGTGVASTRFELQFRPSTSPLPVVLTSFAVVAQAQGVRVGWRTASEWHSQYFAVERSPDGRAFTEIGQVAAAGSSGQPHHYELLDAQPLAGAAYYRLRQVDLDGSAQYSAVRVVANSNAQTGLRLFPVPARTSATLLGAAPGELVRVFDARGRLTTTATADATGTAVLVLPAGLASGLYLVQAAGQAIRLVVE